MRTREPDLEYQVISSSSEGVFQSRVNYAIRDGWEPIGGVACAPHASANPTLFQAMVRRKG